MKVALIIPTRGVLFARTVRSSILNPELPQDSPVILVEGLPIPDAHNEGIRRALATDCTHLWFFEEDMEMPPTGLAFMMKAAESNPIVVVDYKVRPDVHATQYDTEGVLFFGFGCTMFQREVFEKHFTDPWLVDKYALRVEADSLTYTPYEIDPKRQVYGKYDVYFGWQCRQKKIQPIVLGSFECKHLRLKTWERKETNNGLQDVYEI